MLAAALVPASPVQQTYPDRPLIRCPPTGIPRAQRQGRLDAEQLGQLHKPVIRHTYGHLFPEDGDLGRGAIESMIKNAAELRQNQQAK